MKTMFNDLGAKSNARRWFLQGIVSINKEIDLAKAKLDFESSWRFAHCTKCGTNIREDNIGNVDIFKGDDGQPAARHHDCERGDDGDIR